jgi:transcriptional regulator with XRE-family HTH domain
MPTIKDERVVMNLSQKTLARIMGVGETTIQTWERKNEMPALKALIFAELKKRVASNPLLAIYPPDEIKKKVFEQKTIGRPRGKYRIRERSIDWSTEMIAYRLHNPGNADHNYLLESRPEGEGVIFREIQIIGNEKVSRFYRSLGNGEADRIDPPEDAMVD